LQNVTDFHACGFRAHKEVYALCALKGTGSFHGPMNNRDIN